MAASGLSGHLGLFWPDINESVWIGGAHDGTGGLHERGPYWLNGVVPLASLLESSKSEAAASVKKQADNWIAYILAHRNTTSGWLGPDDVRKSNTNVVCSFVFHFLYPYTCLLFYIYV